MTRYLVMVCLAALALLGLLFMMRASGAFGILMTPVGPAGAAAWAFSNGATGAIYVLIPLEMLRWMGGRFDGVAAVYAAKAWFILSCGAHHIWMPFSPHARHVMAWDVVIDANMAVASAFALVLLVAARPEIARAMDVVRRASL